MKVKTLRFLNFLPLFFRLTFKVGDVLPARIRACEARPGLAKCGGRNCHKGAERRLAISGTRRARIAPGALTVCYAKYQHFRINLTFYFFISLLCFLIFSFNVLVTFFRRIISCPSIIPNVIHTHIVFNVSPTNQFENNFFR